ncbi:lipoprotein LpqH [Gulosibacter sp. 10]|uniref:lipoprotein LpqH n=1 Tax=Gulosibacter sp. 10 TaxID=1255570 RepID=UPI00097EE741|nr:lipoprotein LpqH [Gulosibacter sp. 10]SJM66534.1 lipoprotein [Gulosibacter sp. 10]
MNRKHLAAVGTAMTLLAALTACSSPSDGGADTDSKVEETAAEQPAGDAPAEEGGAASAGSGVEITVAGETVEVADPQIVCEEAGGTLNIAVASSDLSADSGQGLGAVLGTGDAPSVQSVALVTTGGDAVAYQEGTGQGSAEVAVDGDTYTITGEGIVADLENPTSVETAEFSFAVTCP